MLKICEENVKKKTSFQTTSRIAGGQLDRQETKSVILSFPIKPFTTSSCPKLYSIQLGKNCLSLAVHYISVFIHKSINFLQFD